MKNFLNFTFKPSTLMSLHYMLLMVILNRTQVKPIFEVGRQH